ncbi:MAG: DUF3034 family protein [Armatimonadetes bacterium]|jgi:hypothetical protein|nr:DUF3034 family protein [Armatimonadota bacterium]
MKRLQFVSVLGVAVLALLSAPKTGYAQATWEGPTGVFLNPLALSLGKGQTQASVHFLDLQPAGSLTSVGVTHGLSPSWEVGVTRAALSAGGANNTNLIHAKWLALPLGKGGNWPGVALGAIYRKGENRTETSDLYVAVTKVFPTKTPVIVGLTARATNGLGSGLFGSARSHTIELGGVLAGVFFGGRVTAGVEYYEQPRVRAWRDLAVRWSLSPSTNIDAGLADLDSTFGDQVAVAVSHRW